MGRGPGAQDYRNRQRKTVFVFSKSFWPGKVFYLCGIMIGIEIYMPLINFITLEMGEIISKLSKSDLRAVVLHSHILSLKGTGRIFCVCKLPGFPD